MKKTRKLLGVFMLSILAMGGLSGCNNNNSSKQSSSSKTPNSSSSSVITNQHYDGQGAPIDSFGINGDTYRDTLTNN